MSVYWGGADAMMSEVLCKKHQTVIAPCLVGKKTPVEDFHDDFVMIRGARVSGIEYVQSSPEWFVSRRVVELLLEHAGGLERVTIRRNEKFKPCLAE
jgi:hypothetical protein